MGALIGIGLLINKNAFKGGRLTERGRWIESLQYVSKHIAELRGRSPPIEVILRIIILYVLWGTNIFVESPLLSLGNLCTLKTIFFLVLVRSVKWNMEVINYTEYKSEKGWHKMTKLWLKNKTEASQSILE